MKKFKKNVADEMNKELKGLRVQIKGSGKNTIENIMKNGIDGNTFTQTGGNKLTFYLRNLNKDTQRNATTSTTTITKSM